MSIKHKFSMIKIINIYQGNCCKQICTTCSNIHIIKIQNMSVIKYILLTEDTKKTVEHALIYSLPDKY